MLPGRLGALLAADGDFALAHCPPRGYFALLSYKQASDAVRHRGRERGASPSVRTRRRASRRMSRRARCVDRRRPRPRARRVEAILSQHPHDVIAFRLAHFNNFWLGRPPTWVRRSTACCRSGARS